MTSLSETEITKLVAATLARHRHNQVPAEAMVGVPWSAEKEAAYLELLKQSLVPPRLETFVLSETYEQVQARTPAHAEYWVVAEHGGYVEWYDPATNEFGLGLASAGGAGLVSIGVRGDLVGVFCAM